MTTASAGPLRRDFRAKNALPPTRRVHAVRRKDAAGNTTPSILRRLAGIALAIVLISLGALVLMNEATVRLAEAHVSTFVVGLFSDESTFAWSAYQPSVAFTMGGDDGWHVARITASCAIAFYLAPILAIGALFALNRRMSLGRIALATLVGVAGMFLLNQVRLLAICFAWGTWGLGGFHWVHGPLGTGLMLVGIAATLLSFFLIVVRGGRRR